jgi:hypothetical protein
LHLWLLRTFFHAGAFLNAGTVWVSVLLLKPAWKIQDEVAFLHAGAFLNAGTVWVSVFLLNPAWKIQDEVVAGFTTQRWWVY